ncbi:MAG: hypothetical protein WC770_07630 [Phycisphaerae bacterium]
MTGDKKSRNKEYNADEQPCPTKINASSGFQHRSYYLNFGSHLLNNWNVNMFFPDGPNQWSVADWTKFLKMIKAFGFTCFEYWIEPTTFGTAASENDMHFDSFVSIMRQVTEIAHSLGLHTRWTAIPNCIGHDWYFACPNNREDKELILKLWRRWTQALSSTDFIAVFPGDPGGCNRNGCDYSTFIELALKLTEITVNTNPKATVILDTWGTPFSGWGEDMHHVPNWDGTWKRLLEGVREINVDHCHIWNGSPERAHSAMEYLTKRLPGFPDDTIVGINLGFSSEADATVGGDARSYVREIAKTHRISSWDYSVVEGELIVYPHWRLPRIFSRRREEKYVADYFGAMSYTMSPKLSHLSMYAAAQASINPDRNPDEVSKEFCRKVFGAEHEELGELFEAFEVVVGWGSYPRRKWSRQEAHRVYLKMIEHLESATMDKCELPLFPSAMQYRDDLLWFAKLFAQLSGDIVDRSQIKKDYWARCLSIYDHVPMSADARAELAANRFSSLFKE